MTALEKMKAMDTLTRILQLVTEAGELARSNLIARDGGPVERMARDRVDKVGRALEAVWVKIRKHQHILGQLVTTD